MVVFEAIVAFFAAILIVLSGGSHGGKQEARRVLPNSQKNSELVSRSVQTGTSQAEKSNFPAQEKSIPTPALLPGLIIFFGKVLRKKKNP